MLIWKRNLKKIPNKGYVEQYIKQIDDNENYISVNLAVNETVLCLNWSFFILIWDYRKDLNDIDDLEDIKTFFKKNCHKISWRSDSFILLD